MKRSNREVGPAVVCLSEAPTVWSLDPPASSRRGDDRGADAPEDDVGSGRRGSPQSAPPPAAPMPTDQSASGPASRRN